MKKQIRMICMLLAVSLLLCACGAQQQATEAATEPTQPVATSEATLQELLSKQNWVSLGADLQLTGAVVLKDQTLMGNGHTITSPVYDENVPSTASGIFITKGTVENVTVKGGYRGISNSADYRNAGDLRLNNVTVEGEKSALYIGYGNEDGSIYVTGSTLLGWTVYNKMIHAKFTDCTFGFNESGSTGKLTAYTDTELIGCRFESKVDENGDKTPFTLYIKHSETGNDVILENCYADGELITQDNVHQLLKVITKDKPVQVANTSD